MEVILPTIMSHKSRCVLKNIMHIFMKTQLQILRLTKPEMFQGQRA